MEEMEMVVMVVAMAAALRGGGDLTMAAAGEFRGFLVRPLSGRYGCLHILYWV